MLQTTEETELTMPSDFRWHFFLVSAGYLPDTDMDLFMMRNVLVIVEAFTMYAKRSLRRLPAKHRLTDIGKIPAHAAQPDIYGAV